VVARAARYHHGRPKYNGIRRATLTIGPVFGPSAYSGPPPGALGRTPLAGWAGIQRVGWAPLSTFGPPRSLVQVLLNQSAMPKAMKLGACRKKVRTLCGERHTIDT